MNRRQVESRDAEIFLFLNLIKLHQNLFLFFSLTLIIATDADFRNKFPKWNETKNTVSTYTNLRGISNRNRYLNNGTAKQPQI